MRPLLKIFLLWGAVLIGGIVFVYAETPAASLLKHPSWISYSVAAACGGVILFLVLFNFKFQAKASPPASPQLEMLLQKEIERREKVEAALKRLEERYQSVLFQRPELKFIEDTKRIEVQMRHAQKMEALGTLAGGVSHDFNNILSAILGYTELLQLECKGGTKEHEYLEGIFNAGNRAKELVRQILTFSRQAEQEYKPVRIDVIIKEVLKLIRASLPSTITIKQKVSSEALVMGDPTQLHQVIMNLCTNAGHAMMEKGGDLEIELKKLELDKELCLMHPQLTPGSYMLLSVSDTGTGIPPEIIDKIFDPFFTTKEKGEGTGMGLSVVHGIVESHGGTLYVYSEPRKGSVFKIFLPAVERRETQLEVTKEAVPEGSERILFVDDELPLITVGKHILESLGYHVTTRTSSKEALELFRTLPQKFDLVITDMTMPNMTGDVLAKHLIEIRPDIPIILCTGFSTRVSLEKAMPAGIRSLLMKPLIRREMAKAIREVLGNPQPPTTNA